MINGIARLIIIAGLLGLVACSHQPNKVRIVDRSSGGTATGSAYIVAKGDTLYAIAWRYGVSYQQLASYNKIRAPYLINIGQRLKIPSKSYRVSSNRTSSSTPPKKTTTSTNTRATTPKKSTSRSLPAKNTESWRWPTTGKVTAGFSTSPKVHKGIAIEGSYGQAIYAAKSGKVVYAGAGLKAYGLLIIVKHDERYLSAYAFNSKVYVKEGDAIKAGQKIAAMGKKESKTTQLYFEIRLDGKPQNPKKYLPAIN